MDFGEELFLVYEFSEKSSVSASHSKSIKTSRDGSGRGCSESVRKGLEVRNGETKHWGGRGGVQKLDMLQTVVWGVQASFSFFFFFMVGRWRAMSNF